MNNEKYQIIPIRVSKANRFVEEYHRHNKPVDHRGHRFSLGLMYKDCLIGVAIAGSPIARANDDGFTLEIQRVCVLEGYANACSMLYGRIKRIGMLMGYKKIITYTLQNESGSSLKAVRAVSKPIRVGSWNRPNRPRQEQEISLKPKLKWTLYDHV